MSSSRAHLAESFNLTLPLPWPLILIWRSSLMPALEGRSTSSMPLTITRLPYIQLNWLQLRERQISVPHTVFIAYSLMLRPFGGMHLETRSGVLASGSSPIQLARTDAHHQASQFGLWCVWFS